MTSLDADTTQIITTVDPNNTTTGNSDHIDYNATTTGGSYISFDPNTTTSGNTIYPYYTTTYPKLSSCENRGIVISSPESRYKEMELPREDMPIAVFIAGRMLTLGIIGSNVEVAYMGSSLMFKPGTVDVIQFNDNLTLSIEYKDEIYHYNITDRCSDKIEADLLSVIKK